MSDDPSDLMRRMVESAIERAPNDADAAEDVLEFFCDAVANRALFGDPPDNPDRRILEYLAGCFRRVLEGEDARTALGVKQPGGKGRTRLRTIHRNADRDLALARAVVRRMNHGATRDDAFAAVAEQKGSSEAVVKSAYEEYGAGIRRYKLE